MNPATSIEFEKIRLEVIKEGMASLGWDRKFAITLRITNQNNQTIPVVLRAEYISVSKGLLDGGCEMSPRMQSGEKLLSDSFVDVKISFDGIKKSIVSDGDRMKLYIPHVASLLLKRDNSLWYFVEYIDIRIRNYEIKGKIEQFEGIEERLGIAFQNFSVSVKDEHSFELYVETLITDEDRCKDSPKIPLQLVVYDYDNNVIHTQGLNLYNNGYSIFQVLKFTVSISDCLLSNISKIRIFPSI